MALDPKSIKRTDFPIVRKGYDPATVDAHLSGIAEELSATQAPSGGGDSLASSASGHVQAIVEAAETSAEHIRRDAESDASATRERAEQHARELSTSSATIVERLEASKRELETLIQSMKEHSAKFDSERGAEPGAEDGAAEATAEHAPVSPQGADAAHQGADAADQRADAAGQDADAADRGAEAARQPAAADEGAGTPAPEGGEDEASSDAEAARLIALNMALNGTSREETAKYLSEHYRIADSGKLLDEVYASVEG